MKEAFEKIKEMLEEMTFKAELREFGWKGQTVNNLLCLGDVVDIVNEVAEEYSHRNHDLDIEASHSNDGWIPCNERLPDKDANRKYLACGEKGGIYIAEFVCKTIDGTDSIGPWWTAKNRYCPNPIAWQPLPAPYKPKGE